MTDPLYAFQVPKQRLLYRGLGGMLLPEQFWKESCVGSFRGGVEFGLMSTTTDRSIAVQYSGTKVLSLNVYFAQHPT